MFEFFLKLSYIFSKSTFKFEKEEDTKGILFEELKLKGKKK